MSRAKAVVEQSLRENDANREGDRVWLLATLLSSPAGLDLRKLHRKIVAGGRMWSLDYVRKVCTELGISGRAHKQGDRWFHGPGADPFVEPPVAPEVQPPRPPPLAQAPPPEPLPPRTPWRSIAPVRLSTQPVYVERGVLDVEQMRRDELDGREMDRIVNPPSSGDADTDTPRTGDNDPAALFPSPPPPVAPEGPASVRWEEVPRGVSGEPLPSFSGSVEPGSPGGADGSLDTVSAGVAGQPAGASAGVEALVGASPSRPGPSGDRQPESEGGVPSPVSPPCPPPRVSASEDPVPTPGPAPEVGEEAEGVGSGSGEGPLGFLRGQTALARNLLEEVLQGLDSASQVVARAEASEGQRQQLEQHLQERDARVAELEAENARLRERLAAILGLAQVSL